MRDRLILVSCLTLLLSRTVVCNQFQNGLMLGFILHNKIHGGPPPPPCKPTYELVPNKMGLLELKMKPCPENIVEALLRKQYHLPNLQEKARVIEATGHAKANVITAKSLFRLPRLLKPHG